MEKELWGSKKKDWLETINRECKQAYIKQSNKINQNTKNKRKSSELIHLGQKSENPCSILGSPQASQWIHERDLREVEKGRILTYINNKIAHILQLSLKNSLPNCIAI